MVRWFFILSFFLCRIYRTGIMKPELPPEIANLFPTELLDLINSYVPHFPKPRKSPSLCTYSPQMERDLRKLQSKMYSPKVQGKHTMFLYDLDDFVLD
jgi:hypothetical protein